MLLLCAPAHFSGSGLFKISHTIYFPRILPKAACKSQYWPAASVAVGWNCREVGIKILDFHISTKHTTEQLFEDAALEEPDVEIQMNPHRDSPRSPQKQIWNDQSQHSAIIQQLVQVGETLSGGSVHQTFCRKLDFN